MTPDYQQTASFIQALTGSTETEMEWRAISDVKGDGRQTFNKRGSLRVMWPELTAWNADRRGIFAIINGTNGLGRDAQNVNAIRANWVDLDHGDIAANYAKALSWNPAPNIVVNSSPGRFHFYWLNVEHADHARFTEIQRKLIATFDGDPVINDPPRVMRIPGFLHQKTDAPHMVTVHAGPAWAMARGSVEPLAASLAGVQVAGSGPGLGENELGDPSLAAPSFDFAVKALNNIDPEGLDYAEWRDIGFAFKQAIWNHTSEPVAHALFDAWSARSSKNEWNETRKLWGSIKNPRSGWPGLLKRSGLAAGMMFAKPGEAPSSSPMPVVPHGGTPQLPAPVVNPDEPTYSGSFLDEREQATYFAGCFLIEKDGRILTPSGRFMDVGKFNAKYGGKAFKIKDDGAGMVTDEAWKAATRGQLFTVPKVDHIRFLPREAPGALIVDEFGRAGVNTYKPANIVTRPGDPSPFVNHLRKILPTERDVIILLNYLARIVQSPGVKIPWAPVIQSAEGVGKNVIKFCMQHAIGRVYTYYPKATELAETGGKFNAWMRGRLFILCDEVRTDEKRQLIEALKDIVSEETIQIQGKGVDQDIEDNFGNWIFFTNWQDAIPVDRKSRRWAIFFSQLQTDGDILRAGMDAKYFSSLYNWIRAEGREIVAHYLKTFTIDPEFDPELNQRAPITSSTADAIAATRTAPEIAIGEAIETNRQGFRGGWISSAAVGIVLEQAKPRSIVVSHAIATRIITGMGYYKIGRANAQYVQEGMKQPNLYHTNPAALVSDYAKDQGYA